MAATEGNHALLLRFFTKEELYAYDPVETQQLQKDESQNSNIRGIIIKHDNELKTVVYSTQEYVQLEDGTIIPREKVRVPKKVVAHTAYLSKLLRKKFGIKDNKETTTYVAKLGDYKNGFYWKIIVKGQRQTLETKMPKRIDI